METILIFGLFFFISLALFLRNVYFGLAVFFYSLAIFNYIFFYNYNADNFKALINTKDFIDIYDILINFGNSIIADLEKTKINLMIENIIEKNVFNLVDIYNLLIFIIVMYFKIFSNIFATIPFLISKYIKFDLLLEEKENESFGKRQIRILKKIFEFHIFFIIFMGFLWCIFKFGLQF